MDANWKSVVRKKERRGSSTPGRNKCASCKASYLDRYYAKRSRAYKDKHHKSWCEGKEKALRA